MVVMAMHRHNRETPPRSFRMPTREIDRQLVTAAKEAGLTASAYIRRALARALADEQR
jgi:post-segregation antitoxin (ccd killing protein)